VKFDHALFLHVFERIFIFAFAERFRLLVVACPVFLKVINASSFVFPLVQRLGRWNGWLGDYPAIPASSKVV
jgi:hypothetical protein